MRSDNLIRHKRLSKHRKTGEYSGIRPAKVIKTCGAEPETASNTESDVDSASATSSSEENTESSASFR